MRNIVLSFFVVAINDALTEKAWEDVLQRLCKVILTKLWTTRPIGFLVSELDACNTTSCPVVCNILTIEFSFFFPPQKTFIITKRIRYDNGRCCTIKYCFKKWPLQKVIIPVVWEVAHPASRGYIFAVWAGVRKVASAEDRSIFYRACAKFFTRFASKINRHCLSSNGASFAGIKKLRQLWSATQESRNALNRLRTGKKNRFFNLFVQISGRIWAVVGRGYFSHDSSHRESVASACRVELALIVWGKKEHKHVHTQSQHSEVWQ